jgi:trans-aconitate 2-methyltransferase
MDNKEISKYYDGYYKPGVDARINERVYALYKRLLRLGLHSGSNVLELGCGIGTMTYLLSKKIKSGNIEAVDLSPESVVFAKSRVKKDNIKFIAGDVVVHSPLVKNIHFITLFDIIEHIPAERHEELFRNISSYMDDNTRLVINIPNPEYIKYDMEYNPAALQIIDQPLPLPFILQNLENNGLTLAQFETYSIWVENDYQFFVVEKTRKFTEVILSSKRSFFKKLVKKIERVYVKLRHNYR